MRFGKKTILGAAAAATLALTSAAMAQMKPEETLKMRQGLMLAVKSQFVPLGAYAQGKADLPADAAKRAENLVALAKLAPSGWPKGSEGLKDSATKVEAFTSPDFVKGWEIMGAAVAKLDAAAKTGNGDAIKVAAGEVGKTCKGCHDDFKKE
ncbi:MAG: c-type cytochrome [Solirubrobacterales bacterium]